MKTDIFTLYPNLLGFIGPMQARVLRDNLFGEERDFFLKKLADISLFITAMPRTKETENTPDPTAWLRYFAGGSYTAYITELDVGAPDDTPEQFQSQCFGLADCYGDGGEMGYISLPEILEAGAELDLYYEPKPLSEIRK